MKRSHLLALMAAVAVTVSYAWTATDDPVADEMTQGALQFLASLTDAGQAKAVHAFDGEERLNFHYIPREREGVPYKSLTPAQQMLSHSLLASGLSRAGLRRASDIMYLEQILFEMEGTPIRDPELYYVTLFGEPSSGSTWGWRFEGHHVSLNFTLRDGRVVSSAPAFMGANPAIVREGPQKGMRALADEEVMGRALLHSFPERARVVIDAEAPADIVTAAKPRVDIGDPSGLAASAMNDGQRAALRTLVELYANRLRPELASVELRRIEEAGFDRVHFAWAGGGEPGEPHYYRIHGPTFLIEYDNTQNGANHIHTVWRDPTGDWGRVDPISDHYARSPHHRHPPSVSQPEP